MHRKPFTELLCYIAGNNSNPAKGLENNKLLQDLANNRMVITANEYHAIFAKNYVIIIITSCVQAVILSWRRSLL